MTFPHLQGMREEKPVSPCRTTKNHFGDTPMTKTKLFISSTLLLAVLGTAGVLAVPLLAEGVETSSGTPAERCPSAQEACPSADDAKAEECSDEKAQACPRGKKDARPDACSDAQKAECAKACSPEQKAECAKTCSPEQMAECAKACPSEKTAGCKYLSQTSSCEN